MTDPGYIQLMWGASTLVILLGEGSPTITQGYSRFEEIERPRRMDVVEFTGMPVFKMSISCLFDGFADDRSVEPSCTLLEALATSRGGVGNPPQEIRVVGPVPHTELIWYIEGIGWGSAEYNGDVRVRQAFDLDLIEKADMPYVLRNEDKIKAHPTRGWKIVTTQTGDLRELAQIQLNNSVLWRRFTDVKGKKFRDWRVKKGTKVRIPR
jgi:hypothetical protein